VRNFLLAIRLLGWKPRTWFEGDHQPVFLQSDLIRHFRFGGMDKVKDYSHLV
jgi:hypothetical protein